MRRRRGWLKNCNFVISGVSSGIGRDLCRALVTKHGCRVFGIARSEEKLAELKTELGDAFIYASADVSSREGWEIVAAGLADAGFLPDAVINNAGIIHPFKKFSEIEFDEIDRIIDTNYRSLLYSVKTLKPLLDASPKRAIVNVSSASAYLPIAGESVYSSTKSAALSFSETLAQELSGEGYYVAAVMPGPVKTGLYDVRGTTTGEKKVKDGIITKVGIKSATAARRIICKMKRRKFRITTDGIAAVMSFFYRLMPAASLKIVGRVLRKLRLKTFSDIFENEHRGGGT